MLNLTLTSGMRQLGDALERRDRVALQSSFNRLLARGERPDSAKLQAVDAQIAEVERLIASLAPLPPPAEPEPAPEAKMPEPPQEIAPAPDSGDSIEGALTTLEVALDVLRNNEPINRAEGNMEQANLEARNAADIERALKLLRMDGALSAQELREAILKGTGGAAARIALAKALQAQRTLNATANARRAVTAERITGSMEQHGGFALTVNGERKVFVGQEPEDLTDQAAEYATSRGVSIEWAIAELAMLQGWDKRDPMPGPAPVKPQEDLQAASSRAALEALAAHGWKPDSYGTSSYLKSEHMSLEVGGGHVGGMVNPKGIRRVMASIKGPMLQAKHGIDNATGGDKVVASVLVGIGMPNEAAQKLHEAVMRWASLSNAERSKVEAALREAQALLDKQLSYSEDLRKPMQVAHYRAQVAYLQDVLAGKAKIGEGPKMTDEQRADWDTTQQVLDERARQAAAGSGGPQTITGGDEWLRWLIALMTPMGVTAGQAYEMVADKRAPGNRAREVTELRSRGLTPEQAFAILFPQPAAGVAQRFRYALVNRPADIGTVPRGVRYTVEPRPAAGQPHFDMARHGILVTERELTAEEIKAFELAPLVEDDDLPVLAEQVARGMAEYAAGYLEQAKEDPQVFAMAIRQTIEQSASGIQYSVGNPPLLATMVRDKLAAMVAAEPAVAGGGVPADPGRAEALAFLAEVTAGRHPQMMEPDLADRIEQVLTTYANDAEIQAAGEQAIIAYSNGLMAATGG